MNKKETIKALSAKLLDLKKLKKDLLNLIERLKGEGLTLSGTHILEKLLLNMEKTEEALIKYITSELPSDAKIVRIASADLINGFIGIEQNGDVTKAFVIDSMEIKDLLELDPPIIDTLN